MNKRHQSNASFTLDSLISSDHPYRRLDELISFADMCAPYLNLYSVKGRKEKGVEFGLRALVLQFIEDLGDREMERYLRENTAGKMTRHRRQRLSNKHALVARVTKSIGMAIKNMSAWTCKVA